MIEKLKEIPASILFGQAIFLISIVVFLLTFIGGDRTLSNYGAYGVVFAAAIGIITSLVPANKDWKYALFDIAVTAFIFIAYVEVFVKYI